MPDKILQDGRTDNFFALSNITINIKSIQEDSKQAKSSLFKETSTGALQITKIDKEFEKDHAKDLVEIVYLSVMNFAIKYLRDNASAITEYTKLRQLFKDNLRHLKLKKSTSVTQ